MFKRIFTVMVFSFLLISLSVAQDFKRTGGLARLTGMGANPYVIDPFFNTINPAWNAVYNNFILGDLGSSAGSPFSSGGFGQYISTSFSAGKSWTFGGILARNDFNGNSIALLDPGTNNTFGIPYPGVVATVNSIVGGGAVIPLDNNVELMATYKIRNAVVGLGVAYARTSNDATFAAVGSTPVTTTEGSASQFGVNLGIITDLTRNIKLDLGASLMLPSANFKPSTGNETKASETIIFVNARAFWKVNSNLKFVPIFLFSTVSGTVDSGGTSNASSDLASSTTFAVGAGLNYSMGDLLLAGGASFSYASLTTPAVSGVSPELTSSATVFPVWNLGVEWQLLDWLVGRLGYIAFTGSATLETTADPTNINEFVTTFFLTPQRGATVGVGFRFGDFSLDATVNEDVLRQGFNIIGGGGASFAYLTASYAMP